MHYPPYFPTRPEKDAARHLAENRPNDFINRGIREALNWIVKHHSAHSWALTFHPHSAHHHSLIMKRLNRRLKEFGIRPGHFSVHVDKDKATGFIKSATLDLKLPSDAYSFEELSQINSKAYAFAHIEAEKAERFRNNPVKKKSSTHIPS